MTLDAPLKSAQRRADPVDMWTTLRLAHIPTGEQNQKKRTYDVLPKPDNFIRYRQAAKDKRRQAGGGARAGCNLRLQRGRPGR